MGVVTRLLNRDAGERRAWELSLQELDRMMDTQAMGGISSATGRTVTAETALQLSAVYACVRILAETVASLPLRVYRRRPDGGKQPAPEHPLYHVLHDESNPEMTAFELRETLMGHLVLRGNAYAEIQRNGYTGDPVALWPLRPDKMTVKRIALRLVYEYELPDGTPKTFDASQILHLRGLSGNGIVGLSPIEVAREAVGLGLAAEEFGARFFGNGARPGVVLEHPGSLSNDAYARLKSSWNEQHQGLTNAQRLAILEEGMKVSVIGVAPNDAQFLETRKFQVVEVARLFRVPPHMIGDLDRATFSNIEQQSIEFVTHAIRPWTERLEQRYEVSLLAEGDRDEYFIEHLLDGLLRGDITSRYQSYATGRQWGWLSVNDIRSLENMNPVEDGDIYLQPMNMIEAGEDLEHEGAKDVDHEGAKDGEGAKREGTKGDVRARTGEDNGQLSIVNRQLSMGNGTRAEWRAAVRGRTRLASAHRGALADAIQRMLNRESNDILNAARRRSLAEFREWLTAFLPEHETFWKERMWATIWALAQLAADEGHREASAAGYDETMADEAVELFSRGVTAGHASGWVAQLQAQLDASIDAAAEDAWLAAVEARVQGRREEMADPWARDMGTTVVNALAVAVWTAVGVSLLRWVSFNENCPYCESLNGRVVGIQEFFVPVGGEVAPEGLPPMRPHRNTRHAPLHDGCDCMVTIG